MSDWLIYGANGYTGTLIAKEAVSRGLRPVLAGRLRAVAEMATRLGLPHRIFGLDDAAAVREGLAGMTAVLHCAGQAKDSDGDADTATRGFMDIPNARPIERLARHTLLTKVQARDGGLGVGIDWSPRRP
jgi:uncharacterized protein YbjT (DUF2867 family)